MALPLTFTVEDRSNLKYRKKLPLNSSAFYSLGGKKVEKWFLYTMLGDQGTFVLADFDAFHDVKGADKAKNILFNDGHVGDMKDISNALGAPTGPTP